MANGFELNADSIKTLNKTINTVKGLVNAVPNGRSAPGPAGNGQWFYAILTEESTTFPGLYSWTRVDSNGARTSTEEQYQVSDVTGTYNAIEMGGQTGLLGDLTSASSDANAGNVVLMRVMGRNAATGTPNTSSVWMTFIVTSKVYNVQLTDISNDDYVVGDIYSQSASKTMGEVTVAKPYAFTQDSAGTYGNTTYEFEPESSGRMLRRKTTGGSPKESCSYYQHLNDEYLETQYIAVTAIAGGSNTMSPSGDTHISMVDLNIDGRTWVNKKYFCKEKVNALSDYIQSLAASEFPDAPVAPLNLQSWILEGDFEGVNECYLDFLERCVTVSPYCSGSSYSACDTSEEISASQSQSLSESQSESRSQSLSESRSESQSQSSSESLSASESADDSVSTSESTGGEKLAVVTSVSCNDDGTISVTTQDIYVTLAP